MDTMRQQPLQQHPVEDAFDAQDPEAAIRDLFDSFEGLEDTVRHPAHYAQYQIEPIEYIMANEFEFWRGNIIKYASRAGHKGDEIEDLRKVIRYAEMRINEIETGGPL